MPPPAYEFRGSNQQSSYQPRHEFTFRYSRPGTSERPLLRTKREATPEQLVGSEAGIEKPAMKFARIENLSDSEEAEMDVSSDEVEEIHPRKKRVVERNIAPTAPPVRPLPTPKWSNPDPYTALPPPDESQNKKVDVVKLIRKARLSASASQSAHTDAVVSNEDFISLAGLVDEDELNKAPENAPTGPRHHLQGGDPALGNRKRTHGDEIKGPAKPFGKPFSKYSKDGSVIDEWKLRPSEAGTPWLNLTHPTLHLGTRLHNEILSFYHWVKPLHYEQTVREDLVSRLQAAFQSRYYGVQLRPFGSFASGLYLPNADIDLVLLSSNFMRTGIKTFGERKGQIYAFSAFLKNLNIAVPGSIETIAHARVPILKFVDKLTGLKVDLSFDNDSGIIANNTFQQWKSEYPVIPVVVSVIKQFLLLRGLNEVPTGGLGGFSITCLVTSLLQHMPYGNLSPNLGGVLMDFFQFYGDDFDYKTVGIRMNPPGYFNKRVYRVYRENNNARLSIEDPNNPDNDISGGTREIALIFKSFSQAYRLLKERMVSMAMSGRTNGSILGTIIAANFDEYTELRWQLREFFETDPRFAQYRRSITPPPPPYSPPPANDPTPPPPPASSTSSHPLPAKPPSGPKKARESKAKSKDSKDSKEKSKDPKEKLTKNQKKQQASRDRATRLKRLRPDIPKVPLAIGNEEAIKLGGYQTQSEMDKDLTMREKELSGASQS
ncbi:topoisomerase family protein Trf4 [Aspergillus cavernicola]|uniref:polynucleotide adenylyltransferase n=1 Tax=Aspergillus cavernicola TaxID=176166 RepID=A0ABR4ILV4_9EURO